MKKLFWIIAIIGVVIGCLSFGLTLLSVDISAPQQAAGAAIALCWVVIPYCLARAVSELSKKD